MSETSVAAESQAPVLWDVCVYTDDRKQRTEVNISLPGAARTVVSVAGCTVPMQNNRQNRNEMSF